MEELKVIENIEELNEEALAELTDGKGEENE